MRSDPIPNRDDLGGVTHPYFGGCDPFRPPTQEKNPCAHPFTASAAVTYSSDRSLSHRSSWRVAAPSHPTGRPPTLSATVVSDTPTTPVTSGDQAVDEVQSDLESLDADLQVIDDALAELDSIAP